MKRCTGCYTQTDDGTRFCPNCGSAQFEAIVDPSAPQQFSEQTQNSVDPISNDQNAVSGGSGNVIAGIVGAFLFSLIGGSLYFVIYQAGIIAGICGLVMFVLANFGYGLFAKTKETTTVSMIVVIAITLVMIFLSEYFCLSYLIYDEFKDWGITLFDAIRATPEFLAEAEIMKGFAEDLVFAYIFSVIAIIGNVVSFFKNKKKGA